MTLGYTLGEESLFNATMQESRPETAVCLKSACVISIEKERLNQIQCELLDAGLRKDYFALESSLKGNYLLK